jgi:hypothetical protein
MIIILYKEDGRILKRFPNNDFFFEGAMYYLK